MVDVSRLLITISGGEFESLSKEIIEREKKKDFKSIHHFGSIPGTIITRPGVPDVYYITHDDKIAYVSSTAERRQQKFYDDVVKSVDKIKELKTFKKRLCIAFFNDEPDPSVLDKCRKYCQDSDCEFEYYTNSKIADLLNEDYQDLREKYFEIPQDKEEEECQEVPSEKICPFCGNVARLISYDNEICLAEYRCKYCEEEHQQHY